jgi:hypothetical protein
MSELTRSDRISFAVESSTVDDRAHITLHASARPKRIGRSDTQPLGFGPQKVRMRSIGLPQLGFLFVAILVIWSLVRSDP